MKHLFTIGFILLIPFLGMSQDTLKRSQSIGITASLPWVNNYSYYNYDSKSSANKSGFVGLGASVFYTSGKNKFSLNYGFTGDLPVPIGAFDYGKTDKRANIRSSFWEAIYHRNIIGRVNFIAGLNYLEYRFSLFSYVNSIPSYSVTDKTIGLTIGMEYRYMKNSTIAVFYRPTIVSLDKKHYWHLVSVDARFDIRLWKRKLH